MFRRIFACLPNLRAIYAEIAEIGIELKAKKTNNTKTAVRKAIFLHLSKLLSNGHVACPLETLGQQFLRGPLPAQKAL